MKSKTLSQQKKAVVQDLCNYLSQNIFTKNCKMPEKEKDVVFSQLKKSRSLFGIEIPYSD